MNIEFEKMPDNSRIWIYQADRELSQKEISIIKSKTDFFLKEWAAHGAGLNASSIILYNQFLIIAVDEAMVRASGCSIDKQVHFVQDLGKDLLLNFMDRTVVAFIENEQSSGKAKVFTTYLSEIKEKVSSGNIHPGTLTFNNLIQTKEQLQSDWLVSANNSWLNRYFK